MLNASQIELAQHITAVLARKERGGIPLLETHIRILPHVILHFNEFCSLIDAAAANPTFTDAAYEAARQLLLRVEKEACAGVGEGKDGREWKRKRVPGWAKERMGASGRSFRDGHLENNDPKIPARGRGSGLLGIF